MEDHNINNTERDDDLNPLIYKLRQMSYEHQAHVAYKNNIRRSFRLMKDIIAKIEKEIENYVKLISNLQEKVEKILPEEDNEQMEFEQQLVNVMNRYYSDAEAWYFCANEILESLESFRNTVDVAETKHTAVSAVLQLKCQILREHYYSNFSVKADTVKERGISENLKRTLVAREKIRKIIEECEECHENAKVFLTDIQNVKEFDIKTKETQLKNELDMLKQEELELIDIQNDYEKVEKRLEECNSKLQKLKLLEKEIEETKCVSIEKEVANLKRKNELSSALEKLVLENKNMTENLKNVEEEIALESETIKKIKIQIEEKKLLHNSKVDSKDVNENLNKEVSEMEYKRKELKKKWEKLKETYDEEVKEREKNEHDNYTKYVENLTTKPYTQVYEGLTEQFKNIKSCTEESVLDSELKAMKNLEADDPNMEVTVHQIPKDTKILFKKYREQFILAINLFKSQQMEIIKLRKVVNDLAEINFEIVSQMDDMDEVKKQIDEDHLNNTNELVEISTRETQYIEIIEEVEAMIKEIDEYMKENEKLECTKENEKLEEERKEIKDTTTAQNEGISPLIERPKSDNFKNGEVVDFKEID